MFDLTVIDTSMLMFLFVKGRGTVVTGRIEQGTIKVGEEIEILGLMQVLTFRTQVRKCFTSHIRAVLDNL